MRSLQSRLLVASGTVLLLCGLLAGLGGYLSAEKGANSAIDAQIAQFAKTILFVAASNSHNAIGDIGFVSQPGHNAIAFQVWKLKSTPEQPGEPLQTAIPAQPDRPYPQLVLRSGEMESLLMLGRDDGFSVAKRLGHAYRIYAQTSADGEYRAVVAQDMIDRAEMTDSIAWDNSRPYLTVFPLGLLALAWITYRGLRPLRRMAKEVSSRAPGNLDHFAVEGAPLELKPLLRALNALLDRLGSALELERRFTGDAAHELRNPIAALRAQLDALRLADNEASRTLARLNIAATTDRLTRLINQLLTLARLDAYDDEAGTVFDLAELARESCGESAPSAVAKDIELSLHAEPAPFFGAEDALRILMRNLLENAIRYTPSGGRVEVHVAQEARRNLLKVMDNGPGVASDEMKFLGQRFRHLSKSDALGVGLGLSIVLRIAEHYGGEVRFGSGLDGKGFGATITFPFKPEHRPS